MKQGYGIMYNEILFDKDLSDKQKLIFCLISSLCAEQGYCWATNDYLAGKLFCTADWISRCIKIMEKKGYIFIDYEKRGCEIIKRFIRLSKNTTVESVPESNHENKMASNIENDDSRKIRSTVVEKTYRGDANYLIKKNKNKKKCTLFSEEDYNTVINNFNELSGRKIALTSSHRICITRAFEDGYTPENIHAAFVGMSKDEWWGKKGIWKDFVPMFRTKNKNQEPVDYISKFKDGIISRFDLDNWERYTEKEVADFMYGTEEGKALYFTNNPLYQNLYKYALCS